MISEAFFNLLQSIGRISTEFQDDFNTVLMGCLERAFSSRYNRTYFQVFCLTCHVPVCLSSASTSCFTSCDSLVKMTKFLQSREWSKLHVVKFSDMVTAYGHAVENYLTNATTSRDKTLSNGTKNPRFCSVLATKGSSSKSPEKASSAKDAVIGSKTANDSCESMLTGVGHWIETMLRKRVANPSSPLNGYVDVQFSDSPSDAR